MVLFSAKINPNWNQINKNARDGCIENQLWVWEMFGFFLPRFFPHCKQDLWEKLCTNDLKESPPLDSMAQNWIHFLQSATNYICLQNFANVMSNDTKPFPKCNVVTIVALFMFGTWINNIENMFVADAVVFVALVHMALGFWLFLGYFLSHLQYLFTAAFFVLMVNDFKSWNESAWQCLFHRVSSNNWISLILPIPITITKKRGKPEFWQLQIA